MDDKMSEDGLSGKLKAEGFADLSIVKYIDEINRMGFGTLASCSGMRRDHHGHPETAYLSVELPEKVATQGSCAYFFQYIPGVGYTTLDQYAIKDQHYIDVLIEAGEKANWVTKTGTYFLVLPDVRFSIPETGSVANDKRVAADPRLTELNIALEDAKGNLHPDEWLALLEKRDKWQNQLYEKMGKIDRSDSDIDYAWQDLVRSLRLVQRASRVS